MISFSQRFSTFFDGSSDVFFDLHLQSSSFLELYVLYFVKEIISRKKDRRKERREEQKFSIYVLYITYVP